MTARPLLTIGDRDPAVLEVRAILKANGYEVIETGDPELIDELFFAQVEIFQCQHLGPDGEYIRGDGETIDEATWWALENATGEPQRSGIIHTVDHELTPRRRDLIDLLKWIHSQPTIEIPDGSNRHPQIDKMMAPGHAIGGAWCCGTVSWCIRSILGSDPLGQYFVGVQAMWAAAVKQGRVTKTPKPGDVYVQLKSEGKGHTGFGVGFSEDNLTAATASGNEGNRFKNGRRAMNTINGWIDLIGDDQGLDFTRIPNGGTVIGVNEATR
ncbi:MAG TPA: hypothetical protein VHO25_22015 [Polyangiaceae bacterium]|nr:hypothetical protein [Polyangiaceae bacterium]